MFGCGSTDENIGSDGSFTLFAGQFLSEMERHSEAAAHYVRAAELAPGEYEAVVNAATALRQADQKSEAEKYYRQAVKLRPEVSFGRIESRRRAIAKNQSRKKGNPSPAFPAQRNSGFNLQPFPVLCLALNSIYLN